VGHVIYQSVLKCSKKLNGEVSFGITVILYDKMTREIDFENMWAKYENKHFVETVEGTKNRRLHKRYRHVGKYEGCEAKTW